LKNKKSQSQQAGGYFLSLQLGTKNIVASYGVLTQLDKYKQATS